MILFDSFDPTVQTVGIFSPSGTVGNFPRRLERSLTALDEIVPAGHRLSPAAIDILTPESIAPSRRAADFDTLVGDATVGLIMSTTGGYHSNRMLPYIDVAAFGRNPKPVVGFSDTTGLLLYLYSMTGTTCFHGPALLPSLGEPGFAADNMRPLLAMLAGDDVGNLLASPKRSNRSFRFWDKDDNVADVEAEPERLNCLYDGIVQGVLVGGNLDTLVVAMASSFMPDLSGAILFWETAFGSADKLRRDLQILESAGVFEAVVGMVVGAGFHVASADEQLIQDLAADIARRYRLPTVAGAYIGHCQPIRTLPIGALATLRSDSLSLQLNQAIVS